jgi:hypothetical protein
MINDIWSGFRGMSIISLLIFSFCIGVLLSPWSWGFWWFLAFLVIYEIVWLIYCRWWKEEAVSLGAFLGNHDEIYIGWSAFARFGIVIASVAGFLVGRTFSHPTHPLWKTGDTISEP